jgi:hypothetical protein
MTQCARARAAILLRGGLLGAQTGDSVGGLCLPLLLADAAALAADAHHLAGMQEAQSADGDDRRLARDYEARTDSSEAMVLWSMTMMMSRRLARVAVTRQHRPRALTPAA